MSDEFRGPMRGRVLPKIDELSEEEEFDNALDALKDAAESVIQWGYRHGYLSVEDPEAAVDGSLTELVHALDDMRARTGSR